MNQNEHERRLANAAKAMWGEGFAAHIEDTRAIIDAYNAPLTQLVPDEVYEKALKAAESTFGYGDLNCLMQQAIRAAVDVAIREHPIVKACQQWVVARSTPGSDERGAAKRLDVAITRSGL